VNFFTPAAFALAALIPVIIVMYLLKLRRKEQVVSSIYLWRRMVRDLEANAPWQRLRRNLLLILQLLFLIVVILALARPFTWGEGSSSQALILILDNSASMAAADVTPNRLEVAKAQAQVLVDGLPDEARVTIITAGQDEKILLASSQDRRQIRQALAGIRVNPGSSDLTAAMEIASAIAVRQPQTEVVILSDGRVTISPHSSLIKQAESGGGQTPFVRYLAIGNSGDNQAISLLSLEKSKDGKSTTAFIQVTNYAENLVRRRLALYVDSAVFNAYDLEIPASGQQVVLVSDLPSTLQIIEARLSGQDILALDDRAWAVHRQTQSTTVTLVTPGNLFLETALTLIPGIEMTSMKPEDWATANVEENSPASLVIFDTYTPTEDKFPNSNLLFIGPPHNTGYFTVTGKVDQPLPQIVEPDHPLLSYVNFSDVNILDAVRIPAPDWAKILINGVAGEENTPLLFVGTVGQEIKADLPAQGEQRVAVVAFDLRHSDLPLRETFPLLLANLVGWLVPGHGNNIPLQVKPGEAINFSLPPETAPDSLVTITRPDGSTLRLSPEAGRVMFADTRQLGIYQITWGKEGMAQLAVNLFSPQESDLKPAESLPISADSGLAANTTSAAAQRARRELWRPLALAALILLIAEWLVNYRATLASLFRTVLGHFQ
jgi:Ca-activated chloride channel family protein